MFENLEEIEERFRDLEQRLSDPEVIRDRTLYTRYMREHGELEPIIRAYRQYRQATAELEESKTLLADGDPEIKELARREIEMVSDRMDALKEELKQLLVPKDSNDDKNIFLEIRAGTGGEEAALFAGDLFRMYSRYAQTHGLSVEVMNTSASGKGGFKEIIFGVNGNKVYSVFKYESGIHRVQRVPETEASGRIHTSAATVAVLQEPDEVEVNIKPDELRIEVCRAGGPGAAWVAASESAQGHVPGPPRPRPGRSAGCLEIARIQCAGFSGRTTHSAGLAR